MPKSNALLQQCEIFLNEETQPVKHRLQRVCNLLRNKVTHYDWVGFYFKNGSKEELSLYTFAGAPTEHQTIPFGKGICGQVAQSDTLLQVDNVATADNYIACNINTRSELVVPLFTSGKNRGQIDIDSHRKNAFTEEDQSFLTALNKAVAKIITIPPEQI